MHTIFRRAKMNCSQENYPRPTCSDNDIDVLLQFIGGMHEDSHTATLSPCMDQGHPLMPVYEALIRVKEDQVRLSKKQKHAETINQVLYSISNAVNTTSNLHELYQSIHHSLAKIIDVTNFWIAFYDKAEDSLSFAYVVDSIDNLGKFTKFTNVSAPDSPSHSGFVIRSGRPVLHSKQEFLAELEKRGLAPLFTVSAIWLGVPLKQHDEVIGVMAVHSFTDPDLYNESDVDLLLSVSDQVAVAIARKRAEDALQKSETRFRRLLEDIPGLAIQGYQLDGTTTYWNRASQLLYGYSEREALGRNLIDLIIPPGMAAEVKSSMVQMAETGRPIPSAELHLMHKDGSLVPVFANHALVQLPGSPAELFCLDIDLTQLKRAEENQMLLAQVSAASSDYIVLIGADYRYRFANEIYLQARHLRPEDIIGHHMIEIVGQEKFEELGRPQVDAALRGESLESLESTDFGRNDLHYLHVWVTPLREADGTISGAVMSGRDITELKRAEWQLQNHADRLRFALKAARQSWFEAILPTGEISVGPEYPRLLGYEPEEFVSNVQNWFDNVHPDDRANVQRVFQQVLQSGGPREVEYRRRTRFDEWKWMYTTGAVAERDAAGKPYRLTGIHMDITERKHAEQERESLRNTSECLAEVFLALGTDSQKNIDSIVRAASELTGSAAALYNRLDDTGSSLEVWSGHQLPPDMPLADAPQGHICYEATIRGQDRTVILGNLEHTDYERNDPAVGRYGLKAYLGHPVHLRGAAIGALAVVDDKARNFTPGEIGAIQMLARALSLEEERHLVEQELKQSEERFRGILQNVATVAVQGYSLDGTVRYWNHASEAFYGYTAEEVLGRNLLDLIIPPAIRDEVKAAIRHMGETGQPIPSSELALMRKDGALIPVYSSHALVRVPGREMEFFCIDVDLSARQQAEAEKDRLQAQLTQAQKLESIGRLAGGVAHDFNNMLGVILGHAELALETIGPNEPLHASFEEIRNAAERSAGLTRQLLAFARKQTVSPKVIDLNRTVENVLKMLQRLIGENIELIWLPGSNLAPVFIDSSQLDQILTNLCLNARDAIATTGKITIETANIVLNEEHCAQHTGLGPGSYAMLTVSDNGSGMDAETLANIFEPFFTTKEVGKGTGLGLATVYGAVKQNHGFIDVVSELDHGTTFKLYLPHYAAKAAVRPESAPQPAAAAGSKTILLVEDEPTILQMTTKMLERMGYIVIAAGTPGEAIRLAREYAGQIDLLLTDVVMPEMNGRDLAKNLLSIYPDIKRLFMSGYTADIIAHHGVLDEGVHFILKPFSMKDLREKLREALEG